MAFCDISNLRCRNIELNFNYPYSRFKHAQSSEESRTLRGTYDTTQRSSRLQKNNREQHNPGGKQKNLQLSQQPTSLGRFQLLDTT